MSALSTLSRARGFAPTAQRGCSVCVCARPSRRCSSPAGNLCFGTGALPVEELEAGFSFDCGWVDVHDAVLDKCPLDEMSGKLLEFDPHVPWSRHGHLSDPGPQRQNWPPGLQTKAASFDTMPAGLYQISVWVSGTLTTFPPPAPGAIVVDLFARSVHASLSSRACVRTCVRACVPVAWLAEHQAKLGCGYGKQFRGMVPVFDCCFHMEDFAAHGGAAGPRVIARLCSLSPSR